MAAGSSAPRYARNDKAKWKALVEYDPDISRIANALFPYGQKYVDQLATGYLALNDKEYLPMIVQKILATAKDDAARRLRGSGAAALDGRSDDLKGRLKWLSSF